MIAITDTLGGIVSHPLLVHIPVVLVPLATIGVIVLAFRPRWVPTFGPLVAIITGIGMVGAWLAAESGESLEERFESAGQEIAGTLEEHVEMGESVPVIVGLFFVAVVAWVAVSWWRRRAGEERATAVLRKPRIVVSVLMALAIVLGVVATVSVAQTGHSGAKSVWEDTSIAAP
jgi:uncharacterized membrane protein